MRRQLDAGVQRRADRRHRFFRVNDLADGRFALDGRVLDLRDVDVPILSVAGDRDVLAPQAAVHHLASLAPDVRTELAPGGHLGVLTGRSAEATTWAFVDGFFAENGSAAGASDLRAAA
jgi:polyhydroxyalkanoate synthase